MNLDQTTHFTLQGKGGIGKTLSASMFIQYIRSAGAKIDGLDCDPQSPKLSKIKALNVPLISLTDNDQISQRTFDPVFTQVMKSDVATLLDIGSGTFKPLLKYMKDNDCYDLLKAVKKQLYYHVVIISGPEKQETIDGAEELFEKIAGTSAKVVIWQNEKKGIPLINGKQIEESVLYEQHRDQIAGIVKIIDYNNSAFEEDFLDMMGSNLTCREILDGKSEKFDFMRMNRINRIFNGVFTELGAVFPLSSPAPAAKAAK
jgi:hypothetical protein